MSEDRIMNHEVWYSCYEMVLMLLCEVWFNLLSGESCSATARCKNPLQFILGVNR